MSEHLSTKQLEQYLGRQLAPAALLEADDHLAACPACRERVVEAGRPEAMLATLRAGLTDEARRTPKHLAYEQLAAYVDDRMDDVEREIADSHLLVCSSCKEEMRDLFAFKETLNTAPAPASTTRKTPGFFERFLSSFSGATLSQSRLAGGVAVLALLALGVALWMVWKSSATRPGPQEIAKTQPSPALAQTPAPPAPTPAVSQQREQQGNANEQNNANTQKPAPAPQIAAPARNRAPGTEPSTSSKQIVVALNDGGRRLTLDNQGQVTGLDNLSPSEQQAVRTALRTGRAPASTELSGLSGRSGGTLMGAPGGPSFGLQSPVGVVVRTETPTFRWNALTGATAYTVSVFDSGFNKVMTSGAIQKTEWTATRALPRGGVYRWQVKAVVEGKEIQAPLPPQPEARFRVLGRTQEESLERAEKLYAGSHLALGVVYSREGLLDEAEREFRALLAANPDSQVAQKLLRNIVLLKNQNQK